jgi:hypothetical protein
MLSCSESRIIGDAQLTGGIECPMAYVLYTITGKFFLWNLLRKGCCCATPLVADSNDRMMARVRLSVD